MSKLGRNLTILITTLVVGGAAPAVARAAWLGYSNDTRVPLVVQVSQLIGNQERRSQPRSINPRDRHFEPIVAPGVRLAFVTIYDAQLRPLGRFRVNLIGRDSFHSIQFDPANPQLTLRLLEVRLPPGPGVGMPFGGMPLPPGFQGMPVPGGVPAPPAVPIIPPPTSTTGPIMPKKK